MPCRQAAEADADSDADEVQQDPFAVESSKAALHSLSGHPCSCPLCLAGKQRRQHAKRLSHPHGEQVVAQTSGMHSQDDLPTYFDIIDYGGNQAYTRDARYDVFGINPATGSWMLAPLPSKHQEHVEAALRMLHAPGKDLSKLIIR